MFKHRVLTYILFALCPLALLSELHAGGGDPITLAFVIHENGEPASLVTFRDPNINAYSLYQRQQGLRRQDNYIAARVNDTRLDIINPDHYPNLSTQQEPPELDSDSERSESDEEDPMDDSDEADEYYEEDARYRNPDDNEDDDNMRDSDDEESDEEDDEKKDEDSEDDEDAAELSDLEMLGHLFDPAFWAEHLTEIRQCFYRWHWGDALFRLLLTHNLENATNGGHVYVLTLYYLQSFLNDGEHELFLNNAPFSTVLQALLQADPRRDGHSIQETLGALQVALNEFVRVRLAFYVDETMHPFRNALERMIQARLRMLFTLSCNGNFAQGLLGIHAARFSLTQLFYLLESMGVFEHALGRELEMTNDDIFDPLLAHLCMRYTAEAEHDPARGSNPDAHPLNAVFFHLRQAMHANAMAVLRHLIADHLANDRSTRGDEASALRLRCTRIKPLGESLHGTLLRKKAKAEASTLMLSSSATKTIVKKPRFQSAARRRLLLKTTSMNEETEHKRQALVQTQQRLNHFREAWMAANVFDHDGNSDEETQSNDSGDTIPLDGDDANEDIL